MHALTTAPHCLMKREGGKDRKRDKEKLKQRDGETWGGLNQCKRHGETESDMDRNTEKERNWDRERGALTETQKRPCWVLPPFPVVEPRPQALSPPMRAGQLASNCWEARVPAGAGVIAQSLAGFPLLGPGGSTEKLPPGGGRARLWGSDGSPAGRVTLAGGHSTHTPRRSRRNSWRRTQGSPFCKSTTGEGLEAWAGRLAWESRRCPRC